MSLTPHISLGFNGQCEAAFKFYEQHLGASIVFFLRYAETPMAGELTQGWGDRIAHATISIGGTVISGADVPTPAYERPQGFSLLLSVDDPDTVTRVFEALAEGGAVTVPLGETFWSARYGTLVDRFGIPWEINCQKEPAK